MELGFSVLRASTHWELEELIQNEHIDIASEWQHHERDFTIRDLLHKHGKKAKMYLALNLSGKAPADFKQLEYTGMLVVPFQISEIGDGPISLDSLSLELSSEPTNY